MAENRTLNARLRLKYDTAADWATKNPVLLAGEVGIESDTLLGKVGDGEKTWQQLEYLKTKTDGVVRFDIAQTLSDAQKAQARANIGASGSDTGATSVETTGSGNAFTAASYNASTRKITFTKGTTFLTAHQAIKTLKTDNATAQSPSSGEAIAGSGIINLHKVSKTGSYNDLLNKLTAGSNITISEENVISAKDTTYTFTPDNPTLAWSTTSKIGTIGGVQFNVTMPANPNKHYTNYLQIKGNGTEAVKFTQNTDKTLNFKAGTNVSISATSGEITISATDTNTATAADNILDGSNSETQITYAPYTAQQSKLSFDTSTTNPTRTDRLNLNGYLYATKLYSGGKEVFTSHQSIKSINTNNTAAQTVNANEAIAGSGTINLHKVSKTGSYNDLSNIPVINQDLTVSGFRPVANTYYKHTGSTTSAYIKGRMYYCDGTNLKKVVIVDELPPAPNNGKLTITVNGTAHTFTANQAGDTSFSITDTDTGATSVEVTGAGNAVTSASYNPSTRKLTLTKEIDFMPKSGGTFTGEVTFNKKINLGQGDANCLYLGSDGRLNGPENRMLFGLVNDVTTFGHTAYPLEFRGNGTRPRFNGFDLALKLDIPDNSKHGYTQLTDEDLNTIKDTGWYRAMDGNTCANRPSDITSGIPFVLEVERSATSFIKQTLYQLNLGTYTFYMSFVRYSSNSGSTWVSWIKQQTMSDDYSQTFSGHKNFSDGINIKNSLEIEGSSGTSGQVLTSQGVNKTPIWATPNADTGATSVGVTGAGNAVTTASYDPQTRKLTLTKGTSFQEKLTAGSNITINGNTISAKDTTYTFTADNPTLAWSTTSKIGTIGGVEFNVTMPGNPNTHHTNYLQIKGNNTEAVKFTQNADKTLNFKPGTNVSISATSGEITISSTYTNTATAADNILDGSNNGTQITYKPYTSQQSKLSFDTSTTNPTRTDRLNLNGYLYATKLYSGGKEVLTSHQSIKSINTNNTAAQTVNASEAITGSGTINLHKVSKTGNYNDLLNKPTIPDISGKLDKTTYEWNKEFAAGSNGAISLGRYNIYDTQLTFDISSTTSASMNGKLVIATQNGRICQAKVFGDANGVLVSKIVIYQSAITNNRSWIEVFCNFDGWSKNKVHIYGVALESATVTNQMSSVTFTNGVPSPITNGDSKWSGTIDNDSPIFNYNSSTKTLTISL